MKRKWLEGFSPGLTLASVLLVLIVAFAAALVQYGYAQDTTGSQAQTAAMVQFRSLDSGGLGGAMVAAVPSKADTATDKILTAIPKTTSSATTTRETAARLQDKTKTVLAAMARQTTVTVNQTARSMEGTLATPNDLVGVRQVSLATLAPSATIESARTIADHSGFTARPMLA